MAWETALVISILGMAFFFVYLASTLREDNFWYSSLKLFLVLFALITILINATVPFHLVDYANQTQNDSLVYNFSAFTNVVNTSIKVTVIGVEFFLWLFVIMMVWVAVRYLWGDGIGKKK